MKSVVASFYGLLPTELKNVIRPVSIICNDGYYEADGDTLADNQNQSVTVYIFLPSVREVHKSVQSNNQTLTDALDAEGNTFDYFSNDSNRTKIHPVSNWWLRSALGSSKYSFHYVGSNDAIYSYNAIASNAIIPALVIG